MSVSIKLQLQEDVRRVTVSQTISFAELKELIKSLFNSVVHTDWENLSLKYVDNENDVCTITGELELREAFNAKKQDVLRLELAFKNQNKKVVASSSAVTLIEKLCQQSIQPQQTRKCWPERINRKMQINGFHDDAILLMNEKKYEDAKELFIKQAEMFRCSWKKSVPLYNIACCDALLGNIDSALAYLSQAISSGYRNLQHIEKDEDLVNLRGLDAFEVLLTELRSQPERPKKECRWKNRQARQENKQEISIKSASSKPVDEVMPEPAVFEIKPTAKELPAIIAAVEEPKSAVEEGFVSVVDVPIQEPSNIQEEVNEQTPYQKELNSLFYMGFTNTRKNMKVLKRTNGNLSEAVVLLLR